MSSGAKQRRVTDFEYPALNVGIIPTFKTNSLMEGLILKMKCENFFFITKLFVLP